MLWIQKVITRFFAPKVFANSLPKAGTHLLLRVLTLLSPLELADIFIGADLLVDNNGHGSIPVQEDSILIGVGRPRTVDKSFVQALLEKYGRGTVIPAHMPYSKAAAELLRQLGFKSVMILRDPRDVVVSHFHFIAHRPKHPLHDYYMHHLKTDEERLMASICGLSESQLDGKWGLKSVGERLSSMLGWLNEDINDINYVTFFEKLIGPNGGGQFETQLQEVTNIAKHLNINLHPAQVLSIANNVFSEKSKTFRRGVIGNWKNYFTPEHKGVFKEIAGHLLIELGYEEDYEW